MTKRDDWQDDETDFEAKRRPPTEPDDAPLVYLDEGDADSFDDPLEPLPRPPLSGTGKRRRGRSRSKASTPPRRTYTAEERFLILDTWLRSKLPAKDFAPLVA